MKNLRSLCVMAAALVLASCGGSNTITDPGGGGGGGGGGGAVQLGSGIPPGFNAGTLDIAATNLAAGGSTSISASLVADNALYTAAQVSVTFSSPCIALGSATITSPVVTATGIAQTNYVANGCSGADVVTATATVDGNTLTATGTITVASAPVGSIQFISATPNKIGLQGTGGVGLPETSTVIFRVIDSSGGAVAGEDVTFTLSTSVGGMTFTPATATSGLDGRVQTVVQAGTAPTTVRVTATVDSTSTATQSSNLIVTTGLPDADSFSIAVQCSNVEALVQDGVQVPVTVRLSDRFQNPVPDGTAVTFNAEGGNILSGCSTTTTTGASAESGICTVNWTSTNPRPSNGRVTVLATAIGEESSTDQNTNGFFNDGEPFVDLPEFFRDDDENGIYDLGEYFYDFNNNFTRDAGDGEYSGLLCNGPGAAPGQGQCSVDNTVGIGASVTITLSGSTAFISDNSGDGTYDLTVGETLALITVGDENGNPMPAGTTIEAETTNGSLVGPTDYTVPCSFAASPTTYPFFFEADNTPSTGILFITVTTPGGLISGHNATVVD
ncbi:MAG: hypothetical protein FJ197_01950 [Gammaproteobacteria bacterium]|nr:hypothetical protein [Gammaproteobacteria bacterium]